MRKFIPVLFAVSTLTAVGAAFAADPPGDGTAPSADARAQWRQHFFDRIDTNHDGVVSRAEYQAWVDSRFAKLDTSGNGIVTAQEIESSPETAARMQKRAEKFIKRYDTSGTGQVTQAQFEAKEMSRFDKLSGGTDTLTEAQLAAHRHGRKHRHGLDQSADPTSNGG